MEEQDKGFLNDTSLSKPPRSPLKSSTVMKPPGSSVDAHLRQAAGGDDSLFSMPHDPTKALHEVTNMSNFIPKPRFNLSLGSSHNESSLGILQMDNFSDFTDTSMHAMISTKTPKKMKSKSKKSKPLVPKKNFPSFKENHSLNHTENNAQGMAVSEKECSDSDIEYDGTNIPELNMEYDGHPTSCLLSKSHNLSEDQASNAASFSSIKSNNNSVSQETNPIFTRFETSKKDDSRDSIFKDYELPHESFLDALISKTSDSKVSLVLESCKKLGLDSSKTEALLQDQSAAEKNFLKSLERFNLLSVSSNPDSSLKFCVDEISARSSSFRSPSTSKDLSNSATPGSALNKSEFFNSLKNEGLKDEILNGSVFPENFNKSTKLSSTYTKSDNLPGSKSHVKGIGDGFECKLNYKNTSVFSRIEIDESLDKFQISDSEFNNPGDALERFQKDEESHMKEHMFEVMDSSKESTTESNFSLPLPSDVTAPSWFLEDNNSSKLGKKRISIGTFIGARTENLGRLSQDSKRERPYFGIEATTPARNQENSTTLSEISDAQSSESSNNDSTLRSQLYQSLQSNNETGIIRGSMLSRILNDSSSIQPLDLACKILENCNFKDKSSLPSTKNTASPIKHPSLENIREESMDSSLKTTSTLTRSSSMNNLGRVLTENKEDSVSNSLSVSNVEINNHKMEANNGSGHRCVNCFGQVQRNMRPPSSCASYAMSAHSSCPSLHGCMSHFGHSQDQCRSNAFPVCPFQSHGSCSHGFQYHNPQVQEVLSFLHQNQQGGMGAYSSMPFPVSGVTQVQGPSQLVYPEKIAIGDSQCLNLTVQNSLNRNCFFHTALTSAFINDKPVSVEISGVSLPRIVPSNSGNTTDIQVTLSPRYEGKVVITVQVVACLNPIQPTPNSLQNSLQTRIQFESVRPVVSITHKSEDSLRIGTTVAGSTIMEKIAIQNKCDASVPLYISLSSDIKDNRVFFGLNQMKNQKLADPEWQMLSPKDLLYRFPPATNNAPGCILNIPVTFETGTEDSDVNFVLAAAIQSSSHKEIVALFSISATVRVAKLILVDPVQNTLVFRPDASQQILKVKNNASINVTYDLNIVDDDTASFSVSPSSLTLLPMQTAEVSIAFTPSSTQVVKGLLQAATQPHGKLFSLVEVIGDVTSTRQFSRNQSERVTPKQTSKRPSSGNSEVLECTRRYIFWKGVDVGSSIRKTFTIRNVSSKTLLFRLQIKEKSKGFKFITEGNQQAYTLSVDLASKEEKVVAVEFLPMSVVSTSTLLLIKYMDSQQKSFILPLIGYSGSGQLEVKDLIVKQGVGDCLNICAQPDLKSVFNSVLVQNTGARDMFVQVVVSLGRAFEINGQVNVNPVKFVLLKNETKALFISTTLPHQYFLFNESDWGSITLLYGDEILRQEMRRSRSGNSNFQMNNLVDGVNFDVPFDGDERVSCDSAIHSTFKLPSLFTSSVKKFLIHLNVVRANDMSQMSFDALSIIDNTYANLTADSTMMSQRRLTTPSHSPPVKEFVSDTLNRLSMPMINSSGYSLSVLDETGFANDTLPLSWTVKPDSLTVEASSKYNRVLLINMSNQDLRFRVECEIHVISVSPVNGIIPAKGQIGLRISIIGYSYHKLIEDYQGYIKVFCNNTEKSILIKVPRDNKKSLDIPLSGAGKKLKSLGATAEKTIMSSPVIVQNICNFPQEIYLNDAALGKTSETVITVKNTESASTQWVIKPISILFSESDNESMSSESILEISPSMGTLEPNTTTNIVINFSPSSVDKYVRFYQLFLTFSNSIMEKKLKFKLEGKSTLGVVECGDLSKSTVIVDKTVQELDLKPKRESKRGIQVESDTCEFPATELEKSSVAFITVKNFSSQDMKVNIIKPRPPFYVKNLEITIKKKTFQTIPIAFKPKLSDSYEGTLELHCEDGTELYIKLIGVGK